MIEEIEIYDDSHKTHMAHTIDSQGVKRSASLALVNNEAREGDYVYAHEGFVFEVLSDAKIEALLSAFPENGFLKTQKERLGNAQPESGARAACA
jgi:hydrogenase maturation factor